MIQQLLINKTVGENVNVKRQQKENKIKFPYTKERNDENIYYMFKCIYRPYVYL